MSLTPFGTTVVAVVFKDREREAEFRIRFPFAISFDDAAAASSVISNAAQSISNGLLMRVTISKSYSDNVGVTPQEGSKATRRMMLYYRNEDSYETISIPSGNPDLLETQGLYAGIRLNTSLSIVADALGALSLALVDVRTPEDTPFPTTFVVGGLAR